MQTLTMQGIAELANVQRPVVSVWRKRYAAGAQSPHPPFPAPATDDPLQFHADEVVGWLAETGLGNNPAAGLESPLHSGDFANVAASPELASALLLLHHATGEAVTGLGAEAAVGLLSAHELTPVLDATTVVQALADRELCRSVDALVEAAFSGARVLDRLVDTFGAAGGTRAGEALTTDGARGLGAAVAEVLAAEPRTLVPLGAGGWHLALHAVRAMDEDARSRLSFATDRAVPWSTTVAEDVAVARALVASGCTPRTLASRTTADSLITRHAYLFQDCTADADALARGTEHVLQELAPDDLAIVVGAADLMTDPAGQRMRARLLAPNQRYVAPLRYVARLPKGLCRFAGRRRLAIWVFAPSAHELTIAAALGDGELNRALGSTIGADILAAAGSDEARRAHVFAAGVQRRTQIIARERSLVAGAPEPAPSISGGERLAAIWEHAATVTAERRAPTLLSQLDLEAGDAPRTAAIPLGAVPRDLARDLPGVRLPVELIGPRAAGAATIIGADEVRDPSLVGTRAIDRLELERAVPRARFTEPGDVIYVAAGGPAAWLDEDGGHVVAAPARILRCAPPRAGSNALIPAMVAADIAAQRGTDAKAWRLRHVPGSVAEEVGAFTERASAHRQQLLTELAALDALERELTTGIADGTLRAAPTTAKGPHHS